MTITIRMCKIYKSQNARAPTAKAPGMTTEFGAFVKNNIAEQLALKNYIAISGKIFYYF